MASNPTLSARFARPDLLLERCPPLAPHTLTDSGRVIPTRIPRVAASDSAQASPKALHQAVLPQ
jgi:hypothetical protein